MWDFTPLFYTSYDTFYQLQFNFKHRQQPIKLCQIKVSFIFMKNISKGKMELLIAWMSPYWKHDLFLPLIPSRLHFRHASNYLLYIFMVTRGKCKSISQTKIPTPSWKPNTGTIPPSPQPSYVWVVPGESTDIAQRRGKPGSKLLSFLGHWLKPNFSRKSARWPPPPALPLPPLSIYWF